MDLTWNVFFLEVMELEGWFGKESDRRNLATIFILVVMIIISIKFVIDVS